MAAMTSPDCAVGKHAACRGDSWDNDADQVAPCPCLCHGAFTDADRVRVYEAAQHANRVLAASATVKPLLPATKARIELGVGRWNRRARRRRAVRGAAFVIVACIAVAVLAGSTIAALVKL